MALVALYSVRTLPESLPAIHRLDLSIIAVTTGLIRPKSTDFNEPGVSAAPVRLASRWL
ncbi:hypothetical protein KL86PLE_90720 [uncultured Pleomorphomonas sp.]|uniref:Uncharacterized protein n=1 Tax=uncultured Pleomorphomonas sp. TaxID=442121 RepID=A0A212LQX6_9HYPH|nr:hypothetical protein KL86PLE_90720 [uncultured Pleomorphomonas sp.]